MSSEKCNIFVIKRYQYIKLVMKTLHGLEKVFYLNCVNLQKLRDTGVIFYFDKCCYKQIRHNKSCCCFSPYTFFQCRQLNSPFFRQTISVVSSIHYCEKLMLAIVGILTLKIIDTASKVKHPTS